MAIKRFMDIWYFVSWRHGPFSNQLNFQFLVVAKAVSLLYYCHFISSTTSLLTTLSWNYHLQDQRLFSIFILRNNVCFAVNASSKSFVTTRTKLFINASVIKISVGIVSQQQHVRNQECNILWVETSWEVSHFHYLSPACLPIVSNWVF